MNNMGITEQNIIKARTGRYKDNEENRRLHRVGQQYGEKKEKTESGDNVFLKYDLQSLKDASEKMSDKINELKNQLKQVSDESDKKELMEDLNKLKESNSKVLSAISQKEKQGVKFLRGKDVGKRRKDQIEATGGAAKEVDFKQKENVKELKDVEIKYNDYFNLDYDNIREINDFPYNFIHRVLNDLQESGVQPNELKIGHKFRTNPGEAGDEMRSMAQNLLYDLGPDFSGKDKERAKEVIEAAIWAKTFYSNEKIEDAEKAAQGDIEKIEKEYEATKKKAKKQGRVYLGEAPNSSKVNLAKYLSAKAKENIDRIMGQVIPTKSRAELADMYDNTVKNFNEEFDNMKKSARANMLYQILTIKAALDGKQGDKADIPLASDMSKEEFADYIASEKGAARKAEMEAKMEQIRAEHEQKLNALEEEATKAYKSSGVDKVYVGDGAMDMYWEGGGSLAIQGPSKWRPDQDFTVRVPGVGSVFFNSEQAQVFNLAGELLTNTKMKKQALDFLKKFQDIMANTSKIQRETLTQYPDFSSDGTGVRIE